MKPPLQYIAAAILLLLPEVGAAQEKWSSADAAFQNVLDSTALARLLVRPVAYRQDDLRIWNEFIGILKSGKMNVDRIRPHKQLGDQYKPILLGYLDSVRMQAAPEDWTTVPEVIRIDNRIQYIVPWSTSGQKVSYCFSFISEDSQWYFQHLESVFIRLDKISSLPASDFPDITDQQKTGRVRKSTGRSSFLISTSLLQRKKGKNTRLAC